MEESRKKNINIETNHVGLFFFLNLWTAGDEDLVFTAEPQDAVVSKNSSVVIDCGVPAGWSRDNEDAGPAPIIEWKRDGVLLSLNGENRR